MPIYEDAQFPLPHFLAPGVVVGGPEFRTTIVTTAGAYEQRNGDVGAHPRRRYTVNVPAIQNTDRQAILDFFLARRGASDSFRFRDPFDYSVSVGGLVAVTGGYQMVKNYTAGGYTHRRPITKPVLGSLTWSGGDPSSVDYTTGIASFGGGPATSWSGEFDVNARFAFDIYREENIFSDFHTVGDIEILEAFDHGVSEVASDTPASTITHAFPLPVEVGRARRPVWQTYVSAAGIGYYEEREPTYASNKLIVEGVALASTRSELDSLLALFLVARGRRSAFQYEATNYRFGSDYLPINATGHDSFEADISLVSV